MTVGIGTVDDSFACPHCREVFTPQTFPFNYQYHSGGMGLGGERVEVLDTRCPKCNSTIPKTFFTCCRVCKKGAAKASCAYDNVGTSVELYHFGCLGKLIPPIQKDRAKRYGQTNPQKASDDLSDIVQKVPVWLWVVLGFVVLLFLARK